MADYREISQEYAKEGIKACLLLNAGAAVALLSQASDLLSAGLADDVRIAMLFWSAGTVVAALLWLFAFASARFVDKSIEEKNDAHRETSNNYMYAGQIGFLVSLICFAAGCITLALGFVPAA